eukprot:IDg2464t1
MMPKTAHCCLLFFHATLVSSAEPAQSTLVRHGSYCAVYSVTAMLASCARLRTDALLKRSCSAVCVFSFRATHSAAVSGILQQSASHNLGHSYRGRWTGPSQT